MPLERMRGRRMPIQWSLQCRGVVCARVHDCERALILGPRDFAQQVGWGAARARARRRGELVGLTGGTTIHLTGGLDGRRGRA